MCVKLSLEDLNPNPYLTYSTSIHTYGVTIAPNFITFNLKNGIRSENAKGKYNNKALTKEMLEKWLLVVIPFKRIIC